MIDSQFFPHILDAVVASAPPEALMALRRTSRDMRTAADARLFTHLRALDVSVPSARVIAVQPIGTPFTFEWIRRPHSTHLCSLPPDYSGCGRCRQAREAAARAPTRAYVDARVRDARVLDMWEADPHRTLANTFATPPSAVEDAVASAAVSRTVAPEGSSGYRHLFTAVNELGRHYFSVLAADVETRTGGRRAKAMHFAPRMYTGLIRPGRPEGLSSTFMFWEDLKEDMPDEVVVHLLDRPADAQEDPGHVSGGGSNAQPRLCKTTLVGGGAAIRTYLGLDPSAPASELPYRSWLRILTPEEYLAEVGPEQVALETKADPYSGSPAVYAE